MKIKKMTADFGTLEGRTLELGEGLNVLCAPNESGKSTWCAFLRAMLYGVDTAQRAKAGQQPDKKKYAPWSGAPMAGSMDVLTESGPVTLRRWTEKAGAPMQAFSATVTGTEDPVPGLTADTAGQTLTGASREVFERSAFIGGGSMAVSSDPELEKRFAALVSGGDEEQSYTEADQKLRAWLRHRRSGRRGAIPETEAAMADTRQELERIDAAAQAVEQAERDIARAEQRQKDLVRQMEAAREAARKKALADYGAAKALTEERAAALVRAQDALDQADRAVDESVFKGADPDEAAKKAHADAESARGLDQRAAKAPKMWLALIPAVVSVGLSTLAAFGYEQFGKPGQICLYAAAVVYLLLVFKRRDQYRIRDLEQEILDEYGVDSPDGIDAALAEYERLWDAAADAEQAVDDAQAALDQARQAQKQAEGPVLSGLDFTAGDSEAARAGRAVEAGKAELEALREKRAMAEGQARAAGDGMVLRSELEAAAEKRDALLEQEAALALAVEAMGEADLGLREKFSPVLADKAADIFQRLTGGRYDQVTLARDLSAKARRTGDTVGHETDFLSLGARDQLYLALRLAVCDMVLPGDRCPIVLDDALAAFDGERMGRALDLLREMAEKRQVLLFTCHERERDWFAGDEAVTVQTV